MEPTPELTINDISSTLEETQSPRHGLALPALLAGTVEAIQTNNLIVSPSSNPENNQQLERIKKASLDLIEKMDVTSPTGLSFVDIKRNPIEYGLQPEDIPLIESWQSKLEEYQAKIEVKYNTLRPEELNKRVAQILNQGKKGVWVEFDIVGLKLFNTYHPEIYGDASIKKSVELVQQMLKGSYSIQNPLLYTARKGDTIYAFVPGIEDAQKVEKSYDDLRRQSTNMKINISPEYNNGTPKELPVHLYRKAVLVDSNNFDNERSRLSEKIEQQKIENIIQTAEKIQSNASSPLEQLVLFLQYVKEKRIPNVVIDGIIKSSSEARQELEDIKNSHQNDPDIVEVVNNLMNSEKVSTLLRQIIESVALDQPKQS